MFHVPRFNFFRPWLFTFLKDRKSEKFAAQKESEKFAAQKDSAIRVPLKERVCFFSQRNEVQRLERGKGVFFFSLRNREPSAVTLCLQQFIYHMFEKKIDDAFGARSHQ